MWNSGTEHPNRLLVLCLTAFHLRSPAPAETELAERMRNAGHRPTGDPEVRAQGQWLEFPAGPFHLSDEKSRPPRQPESMPARGVGHSLGSPAGSAVQTAAETTTTDRLQKHAASSK